MSDLAPPIDVRPKANRSSISNGWRLDGVDNRTTAGRRYRDLCIAFADDLGGARHLTAAQGALIKQLASVIVESEKVQATIVSGSGKVDHEQLVRLSRLQATLLTQLGLKPARQKPVDDGPDFAAYLASAGTTA